MTDGLAHEYFAVEVVEPNSLRALRGAVLSLVTAGLYEGAKSVVRIRAVQSGQVLLEVPFRSADGYDLGSFNVYVDRVRRDLDSLTPRQFADEHHLDWPQADV